jgi:hypothetical protein
MTADEVRSIPEHMMIRMAQKDEQAQEGSMNSEQEGPQAARQYNWVRSCPKARVALGVTQTQGYS